MEDIIIPIINQRVTENLAVRRVSFHLFPRLQVRWFNLRFLDSIFTDSQIFHCRLDFFLRNRFWRADPPDRILPEWRIARIGCASCTARRSRAGRPPACWKRATTERTERKTKSRKSVDCCCWTLLKVIQVTVYLRDSFLHDVLHDFLGHGQIRRADIAQLDVVQRQQSNTHTHTPKSTKEEA